MSRKIYKLCLGRGFTEAYYRLSEEEKKTLWERDRAVWEKAGAKVVTPCYDCRWSTDKYQQFFIMEYPDVETAIMDTTAAEKHEFFRYVVSETILGIDAGPEGATP